MSWLRNSPLRASFGRRRAISSSPPKECDPTACFDSFKKHWQQIYEIIERTQPPIGHPIQDDVLGVVNHLDHMVTLLLLELRSSTPSSDNRQAPWPCLEHLLSENLLDRLYDWSIHTGRYGNAVRLEQLKLYELLVSHSRHQLLVHEPFLRPLLKLLSSSAGECFPVEVEKRLVVLLNQLCVSLMHNVELLDLFFYASPDQGQAKFVLFSLLIPFVHREGGIGQQARDALLLCMSLSKKNENVGAYIAEHSDICPVLVTGLGGLYSVLPRKIVIETEDWHRLTPDDVNEMPELTMFMNSLEFCNAVVQVAHPVVKNQMLDLLYQGFLVPVLGPALLQDSVGFSVERLDSPQEANTVDELIAATAYLDLFLRSITEPGLLRSFVHFLIQDKYDQERIINTVISRITTKTRLCLVSLALFETLIDLNCEDVMLELVFRHLVPCTHVMLSQRVRIRDVDPYCRSSDKFLSLAPACMQDKPAHRVHTHMEPSPSLPAISSRRLSPSSEQPSSLPLYGFKPGESLYGNYHAYLVDARSRIRVCAQACTSWTYPYDGEKPPHDAIPDSNNCDTPAASSSGTIDNTTYATGGRSEVLGSKGEVMGDNLLGSEKKGEVLAQISEDGTANADSLTSALESSGYESFTFKDPAPSEPDLVNNVEAAVPNNVEGARRKRISVDRSILDDVVGDRSSRSGSAARTIDSSSSKSENLTRRTSREGSYLDIFNTTPDIGLFLDLLLRKLEGMMGNSLYVNLHLTGLISRLAVYPQPLLHSFLLNHSLVFQPSIRSLFQVLGSLKHKLDTYLSRHRNTEDLLNQAQDFLVGREDRLANARKRALEVSSPANSRRSSVSSEAGFSRSEPKRRSFTSTLSSVFRRATNSPPIRESHLESIADGSGYRYVKRWSQAGGENTELRNVVMCAVILDEWLKELAAITQEQAVVSLDDICSC